MTHNTREHLESIQSSLYQTDRAQRIRGGSAWKIEQGITGITSIGYRSLSLRRVAPLVHDPLADFSSSHQSVHRLGRLETLRSATRARHSFVDRHTATRDSRWSPIIDHTHQRLIDPSRPLFLRSWSNTGIPTERSSRWRARVETSPRNPDHEFARDAEPNILGSRHATNKEARDDNLLIKLTAVSRRARGTRLPWDNLPIARNRSGQRLNSGRTIPNFLHYHLSYISTEDTVPPLNRYITRHVTLKREKKRRRRRGRRRRKRESIDVVIVAPVHSARNTNNWHLVATFWHDDSTISLSANVWRGRRQVGGGDGGRWQARPNITRRWWR